MKIAVFYKSVTGNTRLLAEAVREALPEHEVFFCKEEAEECGAELYFVGSWTDKGMCSQETAEFLKKLKNKNIAWFGTAGFGGSQEYYDRLFQRILEIIPEGTRVLGSFYCQGKMPAAVRRRYEAMLAENPSDEGLKMSIRNYDAALPHPDEKDLADFREWVRKMAEQV